MGTTFNEVTHKVDILALSRLKVTDEAGKQVFFGTLWKDQTVVVIFIRHFGCIACRAHVDQIWNRRKDLKSKKAKIIFVGNGKPEIIKTFKEDIPAVDATIYTDPTLATFDACGLKRGVLNLIDPRGAKRIVGLSKEGYKQGATFNPDTGTHRQMGGIVAFKQGGVVVYHYVADYLGDFDDPDQWPVKE